ncbi:hypothetical protein C0995_010087 [Termitomyces sp. Mi166|nr:hypothetical protein C0995_010087 [Termitomyces sp. Mi166\
MVAGLKTFAKRVKEGGRDGCHNDRGGMVVLLIERQEGVETKPIKKSYSTTAGTGFVTFDNVFVPYENTLGSDNGGLQVILSNFNHERKQQGMWFRSLVDVVLLKLAWAVSLSLIIGVPFDAILGGAEDVLGDLGV